MTEKPVNWLDPNQIGEKEWLERFKESEVKYQDWDKRWITSLAIGNGAALVAVSGALLKTDAPTLTPILLTSAWIFLLGVVTASVATWCRSNYWINLGYRYGYLARNPELFAPQVEAQVIWKQRPWHKKLKGVREAVNGVDPKHPSLKYLFRANTWERVEGALALISMVAFVVGASSGLIARALT